MPEGSLQAQHSGQAGGLRDGWLPDATHRVLKKQKRHTFSWNIHGDSTD
jgi:hypothetical protein